VAHELFHLWKHQPMDQGRKVDPETNLVEYSETEERDADLFSLVLLSSHPYMVGQSPPKTAAELMLLLDTEAGWPRWVPAKEAVRFIEALYEERQEG